MTLIAETCDTYGPAVCVVIAAYNAEATIARAVQSALAQPEVAEVMVVDDASTDATARVAKAADDGTGRLQVLVQSKNGGPSPARNRAIRESVSPWIGILDADDFFLPGRFKELLFQQDNADLIADYIWKAKENNLDGPRTSLFPSVLRGPTHVSLSEFVLANIPPPGQQGTQLGFIKPIMRRSFLENHRIQYQKHMRLGEDYEIYARALAFGARLTIIPHHGYVAVVRANSLSAHYPDVALLHLRDCNVALMQIPGLGRSEKAALRRKYLHVDCFLQWRLLMRAVKERNVTAALGTFLRPFPVPAYLLKQCAQHVYLHGLPKGQR
jgi:succinoglycan biosynthesis protein ExoU